MPVDINRVHQRSAEAIQAAMAEESANYQRASLIGDVDEAARAAQVIAGLRATTRELQGLYHEAMTPQSQRMAAPVNKYGLTEEEADVARHSYSGSTDDEKMQAYAQNRAKYRHMVQTGQYSNDQGMVKR